MGVEPSVYAVYLYDGGGNRTKKLVRKQGGNWESVTYIGGGFEYHKKGTEEKNYTQIANVEIRTGSFSDDVTDNVLYQLKDHLGSVGLRINHSGSTVDREEYYPFGDSSLRTFTKKRYRYCGKEKDEESGLYYYGARYYMSWACRFISIDPLAADYMHLTPYNYAGNKPITYYDIDGMQGSGEKTTSQTIGKIENAPAIMGEGGVIGVTSNITQHGVEFIGEFTAKYKDGTVRTWDLLNNGTWGLRPPQKSYSSDTYAPNITFIPSSQTNESENIENKNSGGELNNTFQQSNGLSNAASFPNPFKDLSLGDWGNILAPISYTSGALSRRLSSILTRNYNGHSPMSLVRTPSLLPNIRIPSSTLKTLSTSLKGAGNALGGIGLLITYTQYTSGEISEWETSTDAFFGVVGFFGPVGATISILYFGGKALYEYLSGETLFTKPTPQPQLRLPKLNKKNTKMKGAEGGFIIQI